MPSSRHPALAAILWGGFVAGTVDVGAASLISGYSPIVILKYIAGGVLGRASLAGGMGNAVLGLVLQWIMSIVIAAIFVLLLRKRITRPQRWTTWGIVYGVVVFVVMNYAVVPLSALHSVPRFSISSFIANLAAMLLFGWIVGFFARWKLPARMA